jgi:WD40-like Beta Propeller Repeat
LATACLVLLATVPFGIAPALAGANEQSPPQQAQPVNMGPIINTGLREAEPSFTGDGRTMYFNCRTSDICVTHLLSTWEEGRWAPPEVLGPPISTEFTEVEPVINDAGDKLYFQSNRPGGFGLSDVWVSFLIDGAWSEPQNLNVVAGEPPINTAFLDHCLFFSADGNEAFWTSTRPGGFGDNDIWMARRIDGRWTEPENLGPTINGPESDHMSLPTPDGRFLYVTSGRPGGFGGEDTYVSTRGADGAWGPLVNLGPLVNGPGNDRCPMWTPDLRILVFDSVRDGGFGSLDLWWVYFENVLGYPAAAAPGAVTPTPPPLPRQFPRTGDPEEAPETPGS